MQYTRISAKHHLLDWKLGELWQYRGLIWLFTKRSFVVTYKQTVLGPLWLLLVPLLTSLTHMVLFGNIAKLSTDGVPQLLFYMSSNALWAYFAACVTKISATFTANAGLFGKVYFPRLAVPLSETLGNLLRFGIQLAMVLVLLCYFALRGAVRPHLSALIVVPLLLLQLGILGIGLGILISSLTTKYRDLGVLVGIGVQLWMYATPVVYPLSSVGASLRSALLLNPMTAPMELYRRVLLGAGTVLTQNLLYSAAVTVLVFVCGMLLFNKIERTFMDTV